MSFVITNIHTLIVVILLHYALYHAHGGGT
jgi:hypothetical protein